MTDAHALDGLRVLEVGNYLAGPYCGTLLADLGAQVTKIEDPHGGDVVRTYGAVIDGTQDSSAFLTLNRNKGSVAVNLKSEEGKAIFRALAVRADVVVENLRPGAMRRLGLDYASLTEENPGLIYLAASGWGQDGPLATNAGLDIMAQARSGVMSVTGFPGGEPVKAGVPLCDIGCAMYGAIAVLAALNHRNRTGEGQFIDVSLYETGVAFAIWEFAKHSATGEIPAPQGSAHQTAAPYQAIRASDGWFTVGAATPKTWLAFCHGVGMTELIDDERFASNDDRMRNRCELIAAIEERTRTQPRTHWLNLFDEVGVPAAPIHDYGQVFSDEHLVVRDFFWESTTRDGTPVRQMGSPMRLSRTPTVRRTPGPGLGDLTGAVLSGLGYTEADIARLDADGVVRAARNPAPIGGDGHD
ncbi:CaiB/BaiF CoA transferase family protein [Saccharopolyspora pogona]|uniref:CaiB/BaiF CoA transferase family protein n=1 Tax=Saccharopolyspora pogona TaxID=333966 RepID=UPI0016830B93|nr:CoA transferase [Saccharopolyspora pogona]